MSASRIRTILDASLVSAPRRNTQPARTPAFVFPKEQAFHKNVVNRTLEARWCPRVRTSRLSGRNLDNAGAVTFHIVQFEWSFTGVLPRKVAFH